ncbi:MAG: hypothetical protein C4528_05310 [Gammaproteobacteria bacterium]|nr:MAG: hypothetical protein C4528_05310 [Gammaproteobacteria bacterium]
MLTPRVELIYDRDCPNVAAARAQLLRAFVQAGLIPSWREWERHDAQSPRYAHEYGSPTLLIDGADVAADDAQTDANCCRLYADQGRLSGIPSLAVLTAKLRAARAVRPPRPRAPARTTWAMLPAVGMAMLPKLTCSACWPAYTSLLSAMGLGFINFTPYLLPLTALFLGISLAALAYRARSRRGYRPLFLGTVASAVLLIGKFIYDSEAALYSGIVLLIAASLWNAWPRAARASCPACVPAAPGASLQGDRLT